MESRSKTVSGSSGPAGSSGGNRRGFFAQAAAIVLGTLVYVPAAGAAIVALLNPLRQKGQAGRLMRLTALESLPADGAPARFPIIADRTDAWTRFPNEPIGAVFLRRTGPAQVEALQVVCPHAGCFVGYEAEKKIFYCPCHSASFDLSGKRIDPSSPSPRDLDRLEVEIRNGTEVWVKFEKYRSGTPQKIVES